MVSIIVRILDIVAAILLIVSMCLVVRFYKAWLLYAFTAALCTLLLLYKGLYGFAVANIILMLIGLKNYLVERRKRKRTEIVMLKEDEEMGERTKNLKVSRYQEVYPAVDGERTYQDREFPKVLSVGDELVLLRVYLGKAEECFKHTKGCPNESPTMDVVREIAGICIRCMEHHGAIPRKIGRQEGYKFEYGSTGRFNSSGKERHPADNTDDGSCGGDGPGNTEPNLGDAK